MRRARRWRLWITNQPLYRWLWSAVRARRLRRDAVLIGFGQTQVFNRTLETLGGMEDITSGLNDMVFDLVYSDGHPNFRCS